MLSEYLRENYLLLFLLIGFIFVLKDARDSRNVRVRYMWLTVITVILLLIVEYGELWAARDSSRYWWRITYSVLGYWFRPMAAFSLFQTLNISNKTRKLLWIPEIIDIIVFATAYFSPLSFSYGPEYDFTRGPLGYTVFFVSFFYIAAYVHYVLWIYREDHANGKLMLLVCAVMVALSSVLEARHGGYYLNASIIIGCMFYYFFIYSKEFIKIEAEQKEQLEAALKEAENANKAKTQFFFNMSHDIRTPMNAIIGFTNLLKKNIDNKEECIGYIDKIQKSSNYLLEIINNVLEMGRIENGKIILDETESDLYEIEASVDSVFEGLLKEKNLKYTKNVSIEHPYILEDQTKIHEILLNIISNAIKYTPAGGAINVDVSELPCDQPGWIYIKTVISDNGIGMSKEYQKHIFEEFTRERTTTENKVVGTGLGMAITKRYVDMMKGTIEIDSDLGKGTKITLIIPHRIVEIEKKEETENHKKSIENDTERFVGKKILLAEDNDLNAEIAIDILQEYGFVVERVSDGVECVDAIEKMASDYYDLILMDIQMPNMDGYKATMTIRRLSDEKKKSIPIFAMTANAFAEDKKNAIEVGMNGHIAKPIIINDLLESIASVL